VATTADLLTDAFGRVQEAVHGALDGLTDEQLTARIAPDANTIAWLVWHLTRIQDDHVADVAGTDQCYTAQGWNKKFALPFDDDATGYGFTTTDVGAVRASATLLKDYYDAVHAQTLSFIATLQDADLDRIVDTRWDPPVTLAVRLVSVIEDDLQHAGQAAYARGIVAPD
jgi:uncharacterized damage-inducible protein DinB